MADFESLLTRLSERHVDFVIVGGFAAMAHGSSLLTQDVDICCRFAPDNLMRLQEALADLHPVHRMTPNRLPLRLTSEICEGLKDLYIETDLGQLDCLGEVAGAGDFEQVKAHSVEIQLGTVTCRVLSLDALIAAKAAMGRPRDREVVRQLRAIKASQGQRRDGGAEK
jgi:predicted nucleotidyltransferase